MPAAIHQMRTACSTPPPLTRLGCLAMLAAPDPLLNQKGIGMLEYYECRRLNQSPLRTLFLALSVHFRRIKMEAFRVLSVHFRRVKIEAMQTTLPHLPNPVQPRLQVRNYPTMKLMPLPRIGS